MLLTLSAICLRSLLMPGRTGKTKLDLLDLPRVAREELGLHGLNISTSLLAGVNRDALERLRERADKAGCACLLLVENDPQPFGQNSEAAGAGAIERLQRVIQAGHFLGCSCVAVKVGCNGTDAESFNRTVERLRKAVERAERLEMNVLISPTDGLTHTPEKVTELIKKVGGFRVGTFPDFQAAAATPDPVAYLRRLTPYAAAVCASTLKFSDDKGEAKEPGRTKKAKADAEPTASTGATGVAAEPVRHTAYDLESLVKAVVSVGYDGTLAVEYRGTGDAKVGVIRSREALERFLAVDQRAAVAERIDAAGAGEPEPEEEEEEADTE
jgi:sugar phosphate isomerase/epimerase